MRLLKNLWNSLFSFKTICGKQWIEDSMTEKYGPNWLEKCMDALADPEVRKELRNDLKL